MPRDYKNVNSRKPKEKSGRLAALLPFITGLGIGLFVAVFLYLYQSDGTYVPFEPRPVPAPQPASLPQSNVDAPAIVEQTEPDVPAPRFDFYDILPNKEINISEWVAEENTPIPAGPPVDDDSVYILQVGSFKQLEAADQVKARLALLGISADIQRVVINGQDTLFRVRIGPYSDQERLDQERRRLQQNNLDFMLLKLQADDPRLGAD